MILFNTSLLTKLIMKFSLLLATHPCLIDQCYNGTCNTTANGYECICSIGYTGSHCNESLPGTYIIFKLYFKTFKNVDRLWNCSIVVIITFWRYRNKTSRAFAMKHSVFASISDTNACSNNECTNGGLCQKKNNTYLCQCLPGFTGRNCEGKFQ